MFMGCKKSMDEDCDNSTSGINCDYRDYSTTDYDFIWDDLSGSPSDLGPFFTPNADFFYETPVFNPLNPYEIAW